MIEDFEYKYKAHVISVYDGDSIRVDVDLGFSITMKRQALRLARINTPEVRGIERPMGLISRDRLRELILDKDIVIKTDRDKTGKYGRWIAEIYLDGVNMNDLLVKEDLGVYKSY